MYKRVVFAHLFVSCLFTGLTGFCNKYSVFYNFVKVEPKGLSKVYEML